MIQPIRRIIISSTTTCRRMSGSSEAKSQFLPLSSNNDCGNNTSNRLHKPWFYDIIQILLLFTAAMAVKLILVPKGSGTRLAPISYFVKVSPSSLSLVPRFFAYYSIHTTNTPCTMTWRLLRTKRRSLLWIFIYCYYLWDLHLHIIDQVIFMFALGKQLHIVE